MAKLAVKGLSALTTVHSLVALYGLHYRLDWTQLSDSWQWPLSSSCVVVGPASNSARSWSSPVRRPRSRACAMTSAVHRTCLHASLAVACSCCSRSTRALADVSSSAVKACKTPGKFFVTSHLRCYQIRCHTRHTAHILAARQKGARPALTPASKAGTRFTFPGWMEG